ncbi:MAG: methyltransferase [Prevotella sp.]|nr:methyltransferase [Prevotella sp.]
MSGNSFTFKQFTVHQDRCAMKVGTDGTLLGAWAALERRDGRILDIGTGTGLMALMMAQRYPEARVTAIDIDAAAVAQASENVKDSPFASRIAVCQADVKAFEAPEPYDAIVCNPPYFDKALTCPDDQRTQARHTLTLTYRQLMAAAWRLLADEGLLSVIIPNDYFQQMESEAHLAGFFLTRVYGIRTVERKPIKRYLIELRKHPQKELVKKEVLIEDSPGVRSEWYRELTKDFYIK